MSLQPITASTIDPNALKAIMDQGQDQSQKITQAGQQFEAIFVRSFLGDALKPMIKGSMEEGGTASDIYRSMLTDILSQNMARQGVFGLGKQVASQLVKQQAGNSAPGGLKNIAEVMASGTADASKNANKSKI